MSASGLAGLNWPPGHIAVNAQTVRTSFDSGPPGVPEKLQDVVGADVERDRPDARLFRYRQRVFELATGIGVMQERLRERGPGRAAGAVFGADAGAFDHRFGRLPRTAIIDDLQLV